MRLKLSPKTERSPRELWRRHHFSIFVDNIKTRFADASTISHQPQTTWKECSVKNQHRWKNFMTIISSSKHVHFSKILFSRKIAVYYKILVETATRKFRKILSNVTSWRSEMILKKTSIKGIFRRFSYTVS